MDEVAHRVVELFPGPEPQVVVADGEFVGGAGEVGVADVGVGRVDHARLRRSGEHLFGVAHQVAVELVVAADEHGDRRRVAAAGPPRLLPHGRDRPGEAVHHAGIEAPDVDPQFEGGGGDDAAEGTTEQLVLDRPPFLREIARPIGHDRAVELGRKAALHIRRDQLRPLPRAAEGDGAMARLDQRRGDGGALGVGRGAGAGGLVDHRRVEEGEPPGAGRRAVVGHRGDGRATERRCQPLGLADRGRTEDEGGVAAVVATDAAEPPQDVGDMGAEDPPQHVELVDDDVAEPHEQGVPLGVAGEEAAVEHLGVGEHDVGVVAHPRLLLAARVTVVGAGHEPGDLHRAERPELVVGQGLGGVEEEGGARLDRIVDRFADRELEAPALARRGAGRDDDIGAVAGEVDRLGLVGPQRGALHERRERGRERSTQRTEPLRPFGNVLDVDQTAVVAEFDEEIVERRGALERGRSETQVGRGGAIGGG